MNAAIDKTKLDAETLDRIDVRYAVETCFELEVEAYGFFVANGSFSINCGIYSGPPTRGNMADLINSRGVYSEDLDILGSNMPAQDVAKIINERRVQADDIRKMTISEITVDEVTVAESQ